MAAGHGEPSRQRSISLLDLSLHATGAAAQHGTGAGLYPSHSPRRRKRAAACRLQLRDEIDPLEARRSKRSRVRVEAAKARTFRQDAEAYIEAHAAGWRNLKHRAQWTSTLATYAYPVIGDLPVAAIDTALVSGARADLAEQA